MAPEYREIDRSTICRTTPQAIAFSSSSPVACIRTKPRSLAIARASLTSRVLPIPASPSITRALPSPSFGGVQRHRDPAQFVGPLQGRCSSQVRVFGPGSAATAPGEPVRVAQRRAVAEKHQRWAQLGEPAHGLVVAAGRRRSGTSTAARPAGSRKKTSPQSSVRSASRHKAMCPGEWPGTSSTVKLPTVSPSTSRRATGCAGGIFVRDIRAGIRPGPPPESPSRSPRHLADRPTTAGRAPRRRHDWSRSGQDARASPHAPPTCRSRSCRRIRRAAAGVPAVDQDVVHKVRIHEMRRPAKQLFDPIGYPRHEPNHIRAVGLRSPPEMERSRDRPRTATTHKLAGRVLVRRGRVRLGLRRAAL